MSRGSNTRRGLLTAAMVGLALAALLLGPRVGSPRAPRALVLDGLDATFQLRGTTEVLRQAGYRVGPLPLEGDFDTRGVELVVLGSFCTEDPGYPAFMDRNAGRLRQYVEDGGVVVQMAQRVEAEERPPYLPPELDARRGKGMMYAVFSPEPGQELLAGMVRRMQGPIAEIVLPLEQERWPCVSSFYLWKGFQCHLFSGRMREFGSLIEGQMGRGRVLLTGLYLDKIYDGKGELAVSEATRQASQQFFLNLREHVTRVRAGDAPAVVPTPFYERPEPTPHTEGSWTLVVLPDTQGYTDEFPQHFPKQTSWIAAQRDTLDIRYVVHVGDVTVNDTPEQWERASRSMALLEGKVPYAITTGNHDYGANGGSESRTTLMTEYFPEERLRRNSGLLELFEPGRVENSVHGFRAGGDDWLVLTLEWGPRDEVVEWAADVLRRYHDRRVIVDTHAYLYDDDTRLDAAHRPDQQYGPKGYGTAQEPGGSNDGEDLWRKLIAPAGNVELVLCGHVLGDGAGRLASIDDHGRVVHQILANYQFFPEHGSGYLRILEFQPDGRILHVKTYSPSLDAWITDWESQFEITLAEPSGS